jgi:hypothetical protein
MKSGSHDAAREEGRKLAKQMVREVFRDLLIADPEVRASIRPVLKSLIREILQEERLIQPRKPGP